MAIASPAAGPGPPGDPGAAGLGHDSAREPQPAFPAASGPGPPGKQGARTATEAELELDSGQGGSKRGGAFSALGTGTGGHSGEGRGTGQGRADLAGKEEEGGDMGVAVTTESHRMPVVQGPRPCRPNSPSPVELCFSMPVNRLYSQMALHWVNDVRRWQRHHSLAPRKKVGDGKHKSN